MKRAENYGEMLGVFSPLPLREDNYDDFYVDTSKERSIFNASRVLITDLLYGINPYQKILFMGHMGCGKSTELVNVSKKIQHRYEIVNFSVDREIELNGIDFVDVIFIIMSQLIQYIDQNTDGIKVKEDIMDSMLKYWRTEKEFEQIICDEVQMEAGAEAKLSILKKISLVGKGILKTGSSSKKVLRETVSPDPNQLICMINEFVEDINLQLKEKSGKELLVIIEDFDKMEYKEARELFVLHRKSLLSLNIKMVVSFPIYMAYTSDYNTIVDDFDDRILYSMIKVRYIDGQPYPEGQNILREIVDKRMNISKLIEEDALLFMIDKSGGAIRDLFFMMKNAASFELTQDNPDEKITIEVAKIVSRMLQSEYEKNISSKEQYNKLIEIYNEPRPKNTDSTLSELLKILAIIEYNGERWCGVHPVLVDFLKEKGDINANME